MDDAVDFLTLPKKPWPIVFSDIDGTLIDLETYSFDETAGIVHQVVASGVPLVLCSSKTRVEQEELRRNLRITDPFIVENGSGIFIPKETFPFDFPAREIDGWQVIELGWPAAAIRSALAAARDETGLFFRGYSELSVSEVARVTGLDLAAAGRARLRDYSETLVTPLSQSEVARLSAAPSMKGLTIVSGGRFHTVSGGGDKGAAVAVLSDLYRQKFGEIVTIGIGDSANDRSMLAAVTRSYLVQKPERVWETMDIPGLVRVEAVGPRGWRTVAIETLARL